MPDGPTTLALGLAGVFAAAGLLDGSLAAFLAGWAILAATVVAHRGVPV